MASSHRSAGAAPGIDYLCSIEKDRTAADGAGSADTVSGSGGRRRARERAHGTPGCNGAIPIGAERYRFGRQDAKGSTVRARQPEGRAQAGAYGTAILRIRGPRHVRQPGRGLRFTGPAAATKLGKAVDERLVLEGGARHRRTVPHERASVHEHA
jgi:hypothetical protein